MVSWRADKHHARLRFEECGLSTRTAVVLVNAGIDRPELLLSMGLDHIRLIQGIGPNLMQEIEQYQALATSADTPFEHVR